MDATDRAEWGEDELESTIAELERSHPGVRRRIEASAASIGATTVLWQRRRALGLSVGEVARRAGLGLDEVELVEENAIDAPLETVARYAEVVGLRLEVNAARA